MSRDLVLLVSGSGRSVENLFEHIQRGQLRARIALVIADRPNIGALERCRRLGIPAELLEPREVGGMGAFSDAVFARAQGLGAELVVLAGFLRLLAIPPGWRGRVVNIHPALLPDFGGKGMYGEHVHRAVLSSGRRETGCTVHLVDDSYDRGEIVLQRRVPVLAGDDVESLAARVFDAEKLALPEALAILLAREPRGA